MSLKTILPKAFLLLLLFSGLLLSYPPFQQGWLIWFSWVPLFWLLPQISYLRLFLIIYPLFILLNLSQWSWLQPISTHIYLSFALVFGLLAVIPLAVCKPLLKKSSSAWLIPLLLVSCEYLRTKALFGFPFLVTGYTQYLYPQLIQSASLGGVWIISFLIYFFNYSIYLSLKTKKLSVLIPVLFLFVLNLSIGCFFQEKIIGNLKVGLIQPNINMYLSDWQDKENTFFAAYEKLSRTAQQAGAELIIWPETSLGLSLRQNRQAAQKMRKIINTLKTDFLIGNVDERLWSLRFKEKYNSAFYIDRNGKVLGEHYKTRLIPWLEAVNLAGKNGLFFSGDKAEPISFNINKKKYSSAVVICYEAISGDILQKITNRKTNIIFNLSSDGWSNSLAEHQYNFAVNIFRAVESRLYLVRVSDNGISAVISPRGEITAALPPFTQGAKVVSVPLLDNYSLYADQGDLFMKIVLAVTLLLLAVNIFPGRKNALQNTKAIPDAKTEHYTK